MFDLQLLLLLLVDMKKWKIADKNDASTHFTWEGLVSVFEQYNGHIRVLVEIDRTSVQCPFVYQPTRGRTREPSDFLY